jgi:hypothetical protein
MTRFVRIDPTAKTVTAVEAEEAIDAAQTLKSGEIDFGTVAPGISIIVWEYGLLEGDGPYFVLDQQLYAGEAILYGYDEAGETVDMPTLADPPLWLADKTEVELAILAGLVERPESRVNGALIWRWS